MHNERYPRAASLITAILTYAQFTLHKLADRQAIKTRNESPLGEFFHKGCNNIGAVFQALSFLIIIGVKDHATLWYFVQILQLLMLSLRLSSFNPDDN